MVTGLEAAGVALAAFPIAIDCVEYYCNSATRIKEIWSYRKILGQFQREIETERTVFTVALSRLDFCNNIPVDTQGLKLHSACMTSIDYICTEMKQILEQIAVKFEKYEKTKEGCSKMLESVRFTLTESYRDEQLTRIRRLNHNLEKLVDGALQASCPINDKSSRAEFGAQKANVLTGLRKTREYAQTLYDLLNEKLSTCGCHDQIGFYKSGQEASVPHSAYLELPIKFIVAYGGKKVEFHKHNWQDSLRLRVIFPMCGSDVKEWQALDFEYLGDVDGFEPNTAQGAKAETTHDITRLNPKNPILYHRSYLQESTRHRTKLKMLPGKLLLTISSSIKGIRKSSVIEGPAIRFGISKSLTSQTSDSRLLFVDNAQRSATSPSTTSTSYDLNMIVQPYTHISATGHQNTLIDAGDQIADPFCSAIRKAAEAHHCIGTIFTKSGKLPHRVWVPENQTTIHISGKKLSLADLIPPLDHSRGKQVAHRTNEPNRGERVKLGLKLAFAVLQLHETGWLDQEWSKTDILFIPDKIPQSSIIAHPLVRWSHPSDKTVAGLASTNNNVRSEAGYILCNPSLFCLGVVLMELWSWQSIENIRDMESRLLDLEGNSPLSFTKAVKMCFGNLGYPDPQLNLNEFKILVYEKIIEPLLETLKSFCGADSLAKIFEP